MPGVLTFTFDPVVRLTETASVRLETIGLAVVLLAGLLLAARIASVTPAAAATPSGTAPDTAPTLRVDDLVFIIIGAVPGAIVGGRLGYVLDHLAYYQANPSAIVDPAQGGLSLTLAVPFGLVTGGVVARLLGTSVSRWMHAITLPLLFVLAAGKSSAVLGGSGQGVPTDDWWATAYAGPGPWGSLAPALPSHPSQVYEAIAVGIVLVVVAALGRSRVMTRRDGAILYVALLLWAAARFLVAFTWRDPVAVGPLRVEQVMLLVVGLVAVAGLVERAVRTRVGPSPTRIDSGASPA